MNMNDAWEVLGISPGSSEAEIKHSFRQKAFKVHPDVGGSAEEFRRLYAAYEYCLHEVSPGVEINLDEVFVGEMSGLAAILRAMHIEDYADMFEGLVGMKVRFTFGSKGARQSEFGRLNEPKSS